MKFLKYIILLTFPIKLFSIEQQSFDSLMHIGDRSLLNSSENHKAYKVSGGYLLEVFRRLYTQSIIDSSKSFNGAYKIPKKIHQIWLGSKLPERYKKWQKKIKKLHPDWEYKLWTDSDVENFNLVNKNFYDKADNYGRKSDIFRYEILYREGGVYLDCDIECLEAIDVLHKNFDFYVGLQPLWANSGIKSLAVGNAIIGSRAGHKTLKQCIHNIAILDKKHFSSNWKRNTFMQTGPTLLTLSCYETFIKKPYGKNLDHYINIIFPSGLFYPDLKDLDKGIKPYFRHYWSHSWFK